MTPLSTLRRALLRRELTQQWIATLCVCSAITASLALNPLDASWASSRALSQLLRRPDLMVLALATVFAATRTASTIALDRAAGWLDPLRASGTDSRLYLIAVCSAIVIARYLLFAVVAVVFAVAILLDASSAGLILALPRLLILSALLIVSVVAYVSVFATLMKQPVAALVVAAITAAIPLLVAAAHDVRYPDMAYPWLLRIWVLLWPPPLRLAASVRDVIFDVIYIAVVAHISLTIAYFRLGRRA